ncbi:MAG: hypothetical protein IPN69_14030 [Acidobacteria bacterium]|nr:hypothetical protein [Acidobacteriota bacterium]MBK8148154.1 hypothetical protein [Acidobacteriota bacterium]MBK8811829.1 hypothetical protein [Acidobacteriota bacterium]
MKKIMLRIIFASAFALTLCLSANAQKKDSTAEKAVKLVVVVVGQSAKLTGRTIKVVAPVALRLTEKSAVVSAKAAGFIIEKTLPVAKKLIVTYLKAKLPL